MKLKLMTLFLYHCLKSEFAEGTGKLRIALDCVMCLCQVTNMLSFGSVGQVDLSLHTVAAGARYFCLL